ncbi:MAG: yaaH [Evtepia sp.]|jgi:spore germination protein|nr:yaaH [Evtepia sp.]
MAVAPIEQVRKVLTYAITEIPPEKILMGIPNYGYDWRLPFVPKVSKAMSIGNQDAVQIAASHGSEIQYSESSQAPFFHYFENGSEHVVWFEDVRSIQAKYKLLDEVNLLGPGYWHVMRPFAQNWAFLSTQYNIKKYV